MALNMGFGEMSLAIPVVGFWKTISDYEHLGTPLHRMEAKLKSKPIRSVGLRARNRRSRRSLVFGTRLSI
jgi:hypothetical protein